MLSDPTPLAALEQPLEPETCAPRHLDPAGASVLQPGVESLSASALSRDACDQAR